MDKRFVQLFREDRGMAVAEYAVATVAVCALGVVLMKVLTSGGLQSTLLKTFVNALAKAFT